MEGQGIMVIEIQGSRIHLGLATSGKGVPGVGYVGARCFWGRV